MDDPPAEINRKVRRAFCPEGDPVGPVFDMLRAIIFELGPLMITREEKNGGNTTYTDYATLCQDFRERRLHPFDLKTSLATRINEILAPIQKAMNENQKLKALADTVRSYKLTK